MTFTGATQTALLNTINACVEAIPKPRIGKTETKQSTQQLANAFAAADSALENIDVIVEIVRLTQPNFYNGYKSVRKLISTGRSTLSVKGVVTDLASGEPLKNAILSFALDGNGMMAKAAKSSELLVKKTADKGGFNIKTLTAGKYTVRAPIGHPLLFCPLSFRLLHFQSNLVLRQFKLFDGLRVRPER